MINVFDQPAATPDPSPTPVHSSAGVAPGSTAPHTETLEITPALAPSPGETPRAHSAFVVFFRLGHSRSLPAVADKLGEPLQTIKNWSSRFDWGNRILAHDSGSLQQHARDRAELQRQSDQQWAARLDQIREQEWDVSQKLLAAARCFLESFGDDTLATMTLGQVSRALNLSSTIARRALLGAEVAETAETAEPAGSPHNKAFEEALKRVYGDSAASALARPSQS